MSQTLGPAGSEDSVCTPAASTHVAAGETDDLHVMTEKTSPKCIQWEKAKCATVYAVCYAISWDKEDEIIRLFPFAYICTQ